MSDDDKVIVPASTSECQIFPLGCCSSNYNTGDYDPDFVGGKATHKEITQVLHDIQRARRPAVRKRWVLEFLLALAYLIVTIGAVLVRYFLFGLDSIMGWLFMFVIIGICGVFINYGYERTLSEIVKESKDACYKMLDEQHMASFEAKGLRWFLPAHFLLWVELQKIEGDQNTGQSVYIPPNQHQHPNANDMNAQV